MLSSTRASSITYPYPSYILYETLADLQGARHERLLLNADWSWNHEAVGPQIARSKLIFVPNPNSPSGNAWSTAEIRKLIPPSGMLVLDGAYTDFADQPDRADILREAGGERVILTRTLSKSYSMAGVRFGFAIAHPDVIRGLRKVKDSYNCNSLSLAAAMAAIDDQDWVRQNVDRIRATRGRLTHSLRNCGFDVVDSQANFVWATRQDRAAPRNLRKSQAAEDPRSIYAVPERGDKGFRSGRRTAHHGRHRRGNRRLDRRPQGIAGMNRAASVKRKTAETDVHLEIALDGTGANTIETGVGFFDHMLTLLARHSLIDLTLHAKGDLHVDQHHTVEDVGICFGKALAEALGDKRGITRYGSVSCRWKRHS